MEIKRRVIWYVLLAVGFAIFWFTYHQGSGVSVEQLEWRLTGEKVSYSFYVNNNTSDAVRTHVTLVAETKREGDEGTTLHPLGRAEVDLELDALTKRQVTGSFRLDRPGDDHLVVHTQLVLPSSK